VAKHGVKAKLIGGVDVESKGAIPEIAKRVKALREAAGLSQAELASKAGLHLSAVTKLEQGWRSEPAFSTMAALAAALGVSCEAFTGTGPAKATGKPTGPGKGKRPTKGK